MKKSFSTLACPEWSFAQILEAAAGYGYDGVELRSVAGELDLWNLADFKPAALGASRRALEDRNLAVPCVGSSARFDAADPQERKRNLDAALRMADVAAGLGAPAIRVFGDSIQPGSTRAQTQGWIVDSIAQLASTLRSRGVQVWLETHGDFAAAADVDSLLQQDSAVAVGIIWDPANAFSQYGEDPHILPSMSDRIRHVHLKDLTRDEQGKPQYRLTGEGQLPCRMMFDALESIGYDGFISFEWEKLWHSELDVPEIALPHFIQWWNTFSNRG